MAYINIYKQKSKKKNYESVTYTFFFFFFFGCVEKMMDFIRKSEYYKDKTCIEWHR